MTEFNNIMFWVLAKENRAPPERIAHVADSMLSKRPKPKPEDMWSMLMLASDAAIAEGLIDGSLDVNEVIDGKPVVGNADDVEKDLEKDLEKDPEKGVKRAGDKTCIEELAVLVEMHIREVGSTREGPIRDKFGNDPNTSKALRLLCSKRVVTRTGMGGRLSPFTYSCN